MTLNMAWDAVFNAATSAILAALGLWVLTLKPRSGKGTALGVFALATGLAYTMTNVWDGGEAGSAPWVFERITTTILLGTAAAAMLALARLLFTDPAAPRRGAWRVAYVAVASIVAALLVEKIWFDLDVGSDAVVAAFLARDAALFAFITSFVVLSLAFAWLFGRETDAKRQRSFCSLGVAWAVWPALYAGWGTLEVLKDDPNWTFPVASVAMLVTAAVWLAGTRVRDAAASRGARNAALLVLGLMVFGAMDRAFLVPWLGYSASQGPFWGLARLATVVLLAHAILRHDVLGIDAKIRLGISKSSVAVTFVAVFFIASEAAQQFFGERFESEYMGIAAAGALVLGIAPLQRVADRLAEKAVPVPEWRPNAIAPKSLKLYRDLAKRLAADGALSAADRRTLAHIAQEMHLGAGDVHDVLEGLDPTE